MAKVPKKESKWRIAAAIVGGFAAFILLAVLVNWIFGFVDATVRTARDTPTYYYVVVTVLYSLSAFLSGYWCARIARVAHRQAAIGLMALGELVVLWSAVALWYTVPRASSVALLLLFPAMVWAGSRLRVRRVPVKPMLVRVSSA